MSRGTRRVRSTVLGYTTSRGAGESGLAKLVHLQFFSAGGDAALAVSLAGTLFFTLPTDQARPQVAQFLLLTMAPFAILAPLIGPILDRARHGRRWAIGVTLAIRGFLCWVLAGAVVHDSLWLFPCALGCLIASKAYTVTRASAVPRLLPDGFTLVNANSRISVANVAGAALVGAAAGGLARIGPDWSLRFTFAIFVIGTVLAIRLPARVDSPVGEQDIGGLLALPSGGQPSTDQAAATRQELPQRRFRSLAPGVISGMRCVVGARLMTGFLTLFLAFLLRGHIVSGLNGTLVLGAVVAVAGIGNSLGTVAGNLLKNKAPEAIAIGVLCVDVAMAITTAVFYSLPTILAMAFCAGLASQLGKLAYDTMVQRDVAELVRTSVFARSEAVFQVSWVAGGTIGILLPLIAPLGFGIMAGLLAALLLWTFVARAKNKTPAPLPG